MSIIKKLVVSCIVLYGLAACGVERSAVLNDNAQLQSLELENINLDQAFQAGQFIYSASVYFMTTDTRITATAEDAAVQSVSINGVELASGEISDSIELAEGSNTINIVVTSENGSDTQHYQLLLSRRNIETSISELVPNIPETYDFYGSSFDYFGNYLVVGAYGTNGGGAQSGAAYLFVRNNGLWNLEEKIPAPEAEETQFGRSVAISETSMAISAPRDDEAGANSGAVYMYQYDSLGWHYQQKLMPQVPNGGEALGTDMVLSSDTLVVGAPLDDSLGVNAGAAFVFVNDGNNWEQQAKITASDGTAGDYFGTSVDLSEETLVVGADRDGEGTNDDIGSVYVYDRNGNLWSLAQKLTASDADEFAHFGYSLSLQSDTLVVGAYGDEKLATRAGAAYLFQLDGNSWNEVTKLTASDFDIDDNFGYAVSLSGHRLAIASPGDDDVANDAGAVYLFTNDGDHWTEREKITLTDGVATDNYGLNILLSNNYLFARVEDDAAAMSALHVLE